MTEDFLTLQSLKCGILFFHSYALFFEGGMSFFFFQPEISPIFFFLFPQEIFLLYGILLVRSTVCL